MKYGIRAFGPEDLDNAHQLGLDFVEFNFKEQAWVSRNLSLINRSRSRTKLTYIAHGPSEGNPKDLYGLKRTYLPKIKKSLELAQRIRAKSLTIHLWFDRRYVDQNTLKGKVDLLNEAVKYGKAKKVDVYVENLSEEVEDLILPFFEVSDAGLTLDIGHGQLMRRHNTCFNIISRLGERIQHVHVHDNNGGSSPRDDIHLGVGKGVVPIKEIITGLVVGGYDRTMTLEVPPAEVEESLALVKEWVAKAEELRPKSKAVRS